MIIWRIRAMIPSPPACRAGALPNELIPHMSVCFALLLYRLTTSPLQNSGRLTDKSMLSRLLGDETNDWQGRLDSNQCSAQRALCQSQSLVPYQLGDSPIQLAIGDPVRAILNCEFVDGSGSHERLILHRLFSYIFIISYFFNFFNRISLSYIIYLIQCARWELNPRHID